ncbi:MAG: DUF3850 domain-containing protein [Bacillota bacterium]|nr:DUF3850 domain-containing protein [Bacillota bacterium]
MKGSWHEFLDGRMEGAEVYYIKAQDKEFKEIKDGIKQFEVLKNDINYQVGDTLIIEELNQQKKQTGAWIPMQIIYKMNDPNYLKKGFIILGMKEIRV